VSDVARERDKCPVGVSAVGHSGMVGGALPFQSAGTRHRYPPPVAVGGNGWWCSKGQPRGVHCTKLVRVHVSAQEGYCRITYSTYNKHI
jgi:hypothetical protein